MINFEALSKVTYGLYLVSAGDKNRGNGYISNSVFQVSSTPALFAACCHKNNFTAGFIEQSGHYVVSVLSQNTDMMIFNRFGYKSGKDFNKLEGMDIKLGQTGTPIVLNNSIAYLECKVVQKLDVGTHWMFIGELLDAQVIDQTNVPITYDHYRETRKVVAPANAPTFIDEQHLKPAIAGSFSDKFRCSVCGFIYDESKEGVSFASLPETWVCPVCGTEKSEFTSY
jgi:flavin reductase (DIM6/NTAB) family NADH-FMN oxidoreductase RutF/rubredoxin